MGDKFKAIQLSHSFLYIISHPVGAWNLPGLQTKCIFFLPGTFTHSMPQKPTWPGPRRQHPLLHSKEGGRLCNTMDRDKPSPVAAEHSLFCCRVYTLVPGPYGRPTRVLGAGGTT